MDEKKVMEAIRAVRERMGLTQVQFAERIGKSYPTLQRYEGVRPPKGVDMLPILQLAEGAAVDQCVISTLRQAALAAIPEELAQLARQEWGLQGRGTSNFNDSETLEGSPATSAGIVLKEESDYNNSHLENIAAILRDAALPGSTLAAIVDVVRASVSVAVAAQQRNTQQNESRAEQDSSVFQPLEPIESLDRDASTTKDARGERRQARKTA